MTSRPLFAPTARQTNWLILLGLLSLGYALYLRYLAVELSSVGLACQGGLQTWLCATRQFVMTLFNNSVFGWVAIGAATINLIRPTLPVFALGLMAAAFGVVLYNVELSALAAALLVLSFARPVAIESELD
ncbi:hypothetical protein [Pseudorhodoplanes sp.]|uniref:hypothetical protein n=1 Tax=Pseudorhodoplanes sp. TaxID=1934341 RepID=UPI002B61D477|nr:hypothetical protein [Pseudorhodoplanes sp.]HWV50939.1 hypothetical protein [Pseudorhodoplanes sp.]